jgi:nicotinamide mononucleotide transporter
MLPALLHGIARLGDINAIFFTVLDYPMSYIEFFGTIFTIWCVWLTAKAKVLSWPVGIIGTVLYLALFYQISLYSDLFEQSYFLVTSFIGWWVWLHPRTRTEANKDDELKIGRNSARQNWICVGVIAAGTALLTWVTVNLNVWLPSYFPEPAAFPFLDALTTAMSFTAQWLLTRKRLENWLLWIVVDAIDVWLYWAKGVKFVSIEYCLFFFIASYGFFKWLREYGQYKKDLRIAYETAGA